MAGLLVLGACELVAGIALRNDALAARARAEVHRRSMEAHFERELLYAARIAEFCSPQALAERDARREEALASYVPEL